MPRPFNVIRTMRLSYPEGTSPGPAGPRLTLDARDLIHVECDLCGADSCRTVMRKSAVLYDAQFTIVQCRCCSHVYVNPRLTDSAIEALYVEEYYSGLGFDRGVRYSDRAADDDLPLIYSGELRTLRDLYGDLANASILDVGCGSGGFVRALRRIGSRASGFDTSTVAQKMSAEYGAPLAAYSLEELHGSGQTYDIVSALEVIEHTTSPTQFLRSVSTLVRPGGLLFIGTGNWNLIRWVPGTPYVMPEGHIHYFTPSTLAAFFLKVGLEIAGRATYTWAGWRYLGMRLGRADVVATRVASAVISSVAPGYGPFPVARARVG